MSTENNKISYALFEFETRTAEIIPDAVITTVKAAYKKYIQNKILSLKRKKLKLNSVV
jgi:hypothetical protein